MLRSLFKPTDRDEMARRAKRRERATRMTGNYHSTFRNVFPLRAEQSTAQHRFSLLFLPCQLLDSCQLLLLQFFSVAVLLCLSPQKLQYPSANFSMFCLSIVFVHIPACTFLAKDFECRDKRMKKARNVLKRIVFALEMSFTFGQRQNMNFKWRLLNVAIVQLALWINCHVNDRVLCSWSFN